MDSVHSSDESEQEHPETTLGVSKGARGKLLLKLRRMHEVMYKEAEEQGTRLLRCFRWNPECTTLQAEDYAIWLGPRIPEAKYGK